MTEIALLSPCVCYNFSKKRCDEISPTILFYLAEMATSTYVGLKQEILDKYLNLDQKNAVQVLYVWIDGSGQTMRCKTKTVYTQPKSFSDCPVWNFDGSSTGQAEGRDSDVYLHPVAMFPDPFRKGSNKIVLCETYTHDHKPTASNKRRSCFEVMTRPEVKVYMAALHFT